MGGPRVPSFNISCVQASNVNLENYFPVLLFLLVALFFGGSSLLLGRILAPHKPDAEKTSFYAEYGNYGPGAASRGDRVPWAHFLKPRQLADYTPENVLGPSEEWYFKVFSLKPSRAMISFSASKRSLPTFRSSSRASTQPFSLKKFISGP